MTRDVCLTSGDIWNKGSQRGQTEPPLSTLMSALCPASRSRAGTWCVWGTVIKSVCFSFKIILSAAWQKSAALPPFSVWTLVSGRQTDVIHFFSLFHLSCVFPYFLLHFFHWSEIMKKSLKNWNWVFSAGTSDTNRPTILWLIEVIFECKPLRTEETTHYIWTGSLTVSDWTDLFFCKLPLAVQTPENKHIHTSTTSIDHNWNIFSTFYQQNKLNLPSHQQSNTVTFGPLSYHLNISCRFLLWVLNQTEETWRESKWKTFSYKVFSHWNVWKDILTFIVWLTDVEESSCEAVQAEETLNPKHPPLNTVSKSKIWQKKYI